ncbi:imidazoleglycerol-phosphate dehydratase HisB [Myxococcota bacterium]|jgi:imidazoleglycerol-phosphate dehydratase|nr:imidazoleglycerol-phosphate dehydratase HisB [Myxococcota bacterium]
MSERSSIIKRKTRETDIEISFEIEGTGRYEIETGIPFFNHMLESFSKHGLFDLTIKASGDLEVDLHHTIEDVGIVLGQAIRQSLDSSESIRRYGFFVLPMADARVDVALDVSNRPFLVYKVDLENTRVGGFDVSLIEDFLGALAQHAGLDLHVGLVYGKSPHHVAEAIFKGFAKALRGALEIDPRGSGVPSVKGAL